MTHKGTFIGIDEVGRGALAGPVVVGALFLTKKGYAAVRKFKIPFRDSKKLSEKQRNEWFSYIKALRRDKLLAYSTASIAPAVIDRINITQAANRSATKAFKKVLDAEPRAYHAHVLLDGGLYLNKKALVSLRYTKKPLTIIKGDETIPAIKLASIVAKVTRDNKMRRLHEDFPDYKLHAHKGYGTKAHIAALKRCGPSSIHRRTFLTRILYIER